MVTATKSSIYKKNQLEGINQSISDQEVHTIHLATREKERKRERDEEERQR